MGDVKLRKGDFLIAQERFWVSRLHADGYEVVRWRIVRAYRCTRAGVVIEYKHPADYPLLWQGRGDTRRTSCDLYAIGREHTESMVAATVGKTRDELRFDTLDEAQAAVKSMLAADSVTVDTSTFS